VNDPSTSASTGDVQPTPEEIFAQFDKNADNQVDLQELQEALLAMLPPTTPESDRVVEKTKNEASFAEADIDKSGGLSLAEFVPAMEKYLNGGATTSDATT